MTEEMQSEMKNGLNQMQVAQKLAGKYQEEVKKILEEEYENTSFCL
jgi:hypothetical protein